MKRLLSIAIVAAAALTAFAASALPAFGDDSGTVNAQVTVDAPCITVGPTGGIDFGTLLLETSGRNGVPNGGVSFTNCSGQDEKIFVRGTGGSAASWNLDSTIDDCTSEALDNYSLLVQEQAQLATWQVILTETDRLASSGPFSAGEHPVDTFLYMPCTGSSGAGETMSFQIVFTASF